MCTYATQTKTCKSRNFWKTTNFRVSCWISSTAKYKASADSWIYNFRPSHILLYTFSDSCATFSSVTCHNVPTTDGNPANCMVEQRLIDSSSSLRSRVLADWQAARKANWADGKYKVARSASVSGDVCQSPNKDCALRWVRWWGCMAREMNNLMSLESI